MDKSTFEITKMDCPSEETLIRMKLESFTYIKNLDFDLENRRLTVYHDGLTNEIEKSIEDLKLNSRRIGTEKITLQLNVDSKKNHRHLLWTVLLINFGFFAVESVTGLISKSMGLMADSLDMLADALVYGLSLYAVGRTIQAKKNVARLSGYFQMVLAIVGFIEVIRRFILVDKPPNYSTMIVVSIFALVGNGFVCICYNRQKVTKPTLKQV